MYGGYYGYGYYWDPTYFLVLVGLVLCLGASALVNSTMRKYSKVRNMRGLTGAEAARNILNREGLYNVQIECLNSDDGDHYDPRTDTVRLSYNNFNGTSVTAVIRNLPHIRLEVLHSFHIWFLKTESTFHLS